MLFYRVNIAWLVLQMLVLDVHLMCHVEVENTCAETLWEQ